MQDASGRSGPCQKKLEIATAHKVSLLSEGWVLNWKGQGALISLMSFYVVFVVVQVFLVLLWPTFDVGKCTGLRARTSPMPQGIAAP